MQRFEQHLIRRDTTHTNDHEMFSRQTPSNQISPNSHAWANFLCHCQRSGQRYTRGKFVGARTASQSRIPPQFFLGFGTGLRIFLPESKSLFLVGLFGILSLRVCTIPETDTATVSILVQIFSGIISPILLRTIPVSLRICDAFWVGTLP
jgi:hypothetical protein